MKLLAFLLLICASFAAAQTCRVPDFPATGTVDGTIQRTDCFISDFLKNYPSARVPAHAWKLTVRKSAVYRIKVSSTTMDPMVVIANNSGEIVDADDDGGGGTDAELLMQLTAGEYTVLATVAFGQPSSYRLTSEITPVRPCRPRSVNLPSDTDGEFTSQSCRFADVIPMLSSHSGLDTYTFESKQPFLLNARMDSTAVDSYLGVLGSDGKVIAFDDDGGGGRNARLRLSMPAGVSTLIATTAAPGNGFYRLRLEAEERRSCEISAINPGATLQGTLTRDGCRMLDAFNGSRDENRIARYRFELRQTVLVRLAASSAEFDTYLALYDAGGKLVADNDNVDRTTTNSAVVASLPSGIYTAIVRGMRAGIGAFELALGTEYTKNCEIAALASPGTTSGTLNASRCRMLDLIAPGTGQFAAQAFRLTQETKAVVSLQTSVAAANATPPFIDLHNAAGELITTFLPNSKVEQLLLPGEYRAIVWHRTATGNFDVVGTTREPAACPASEITAGTSATGTLNGVDCMLRELIPRSAPLHPADVYSVRFGEPDTVAVSVTPTRDEFLPDIYVLNSDGAVVAEGLESVRFDAKPGTYSIVVSTWFRGGGDYSISVGGKPPTSE